MTEELKWLFREYETCVWTWKFHHLLGSQINDKDIKEDVEYGKNRAQEIKEQIISRFKNTNESKWVKFDPEDESTWPAERTRVWVISKKRKKIYIEHFWKGLIERYSHWMEIKYPEPPEQE
jgi:hypothetical protein